MTLYNVTKLLINSDLIYLQINTLSFDSTRLAGHRAKYSLENSHVNQLFSINFTLILVVLLRCIDLLATAL